MKNLIILMSMFISVNSFAEGSSCPLKGSGKDCEVVRVVTRCDVDKQKLRNKISKLEKQLAELENRKPETKIVEYPYPVEKIVTNVVDRVVVRERIVEKTKIKKHIISVIALDSVKSINATNVSTNMSKASVESGLVPGVIYQYQLNMGLTFLGGASFGNTVKPIFGLGYEF